MAYKINQLAAAASVVATDLIELSKVSTAVAMTATTLSAQASDNSFNDSAAQFIAEGFAVGNNVKVTGFTGNVANNIFSAKITALTAGKMTIAGTDGDVIVDDAAGESVTIAKWESYYATGAALAAYVGAGAGGTELKGLTFTSDTGSTADSDPGAGLFKWNNATQSSATVLFIDNATLDAVTATTLFAAMRSGGFIYIQQGDDSTKWQYWRITALEAASGYYKFTVTLMAAGVAIDDNKTCYLDFRSGQLMVWAIACSDLITHITTGTGKASFRVPLDANLIEVQGSLDTPQTAGSIFTVDVNESGTTVLSTKLTIDNSEETSITAATPPVISDTVLTKGNKISVDVDQVGTAAAKGLMVYLIVSLR